MACAAVVAVHSVGCSANHGPDVGIDSDHAGDAPCTYGDRPGSCTSGGCWPLGTHAERTACEESSPCTTEYGVSEGTTCAGVAPATYCVESCAEQAEMCGDAQDECLPVVGEDAGVCALFVL